MLKRLSCMDPFPLKKQTQGHQKEIYINNDGWKEKLEYGCLILCWNSFPVIIKVIFPQ